jgi:soluble lytic murein transglycosylase-like protein
MSNAFCFDEAGNAYGINSGLLKGIAKVESGMNPNSVNINSNGSKDLGLMQINSSWISGMRLDYGRLMSDPCYNVMTGARILKICIDKHGYEWKAVGCYNAVSSNKRVDYSWKVFNMMKKAQGRKDSNEKGSEKLIVTSDKSKDKVKDSLLVTSNSSLSFSVRDSAAVE